VERFDGKRWARTEIAGSLAACVDALVSSGVPPKRK
jgi:hypothetical protein